MKNFKRFSLLLLFLAAIFAVIFYNRSIGDFKNKSQAEPTFQIKFTSDLLHSNLYPPTDLKKDNSDEESIRISWKFPQKKLVTDAGIPWEYAVISGFRIYRDGFWYTDTAKDTSSFLDTGLSSGESYSYQVSALTFDNKIEGEKGPAITVTTKGWKGSSQNSAIKSPVSSILVEGDSIAAGQRANPGQGYADTISEWVKKRGGKLVNMAKENSYSFDIAGRIATESAQVNPDTVILGVGMNDMFAQINYLGNWSILSFIENYDSIIKNIGEGKNIVIVSITPAKGKEDKRAVWNRALRDLAFRHGAVFIDTSDLGDTYLVDAIHPSQALHNIVGKRIIEALSARLN